MTEKWSLLVRPIPVLDSPLLADKSNMQLIGWGRGKNRKFMEDPVGLGWLRDFMFELMDNRRSIKTIEVFGYHIGMFLDFMQDRGLKLSDVKEIDVREYKSFLNYRVLKFKTKSEEITVFPDGRTIVSGTTDLSRAKTIFSKYIGD